MIDFNNLEKLWASTRIKKNGKPLDTVSSFVRGRRGRHNYMRNSHLFKVNDSNWYVTLHGNRIADIVRLDSGLAQVTVRNVEEYATNTTSARLGSILGVPVWKHDNRLRAEIRNCDPDLNTYRTAAPLVNGQMFHVTQHGIVCLNPELVTETRTRVLKEPSKPVLAYLRELKKLATVMARVGHITYAELKPYVHMVLDAPSPDHKPDVADCLQLMARGLRRVVPPYAILGRAERGEDVDLDRLLQSITKGLSELKDAMYSKHGVYEQYTYSFKEHFHAVT